MSTSGIGSSPSNVIPSYTPTTTTPASSTFIYRVGLTSDKIYRASVDLATGELSEHPATAIASGADPSSLAVSPDGKFLYVANSGNNTVTTFSLDQTTGEPTLVFTHPTTTAPLKLLMDPLGRFLFGLEYGFIVSYKINAVTGEPTWQGVTSITNGGLALATDSAGKFLYKSSTGTGIQSYDIDPVSGLLSNASPIFGSASTALKVNPTTTRLYGPSYAGTNVLLYNVDPTLGTLTFGNFLSTGVIFPYYDFEFNAAGDRAYMVNNYLGKIESWTVNAGTGGLTLLNSLSLPNGCLPKSLSLHGSFIYTGCTNGSGKTFTFKIESDGSLTETSSTSLSGLVIEKVVTVTF